MMDWLELLIAFIIANLLGYGGGPSTIPLIYNEVVGRYQWLDDTAFSNVLALGNSLPGPIATKIAAFVGYDVAGFAGVLITTAATVVPSAVALIILLRILQKHRQSPVVKGMTLLIQPVIAIMMLILTWNMGATSIASIGWLQSLIIAGVAYWAMERRKIHPAFVIIAAFIYGGLALPYFT